MSPRSGRDGGGRERQRARAGGHANARLACGAELFEEIGIRTELQEPLERERREIALRISGKQRHDPVDVADRQVRRDEAADEPIDRRVAADAESDRQDQREAQAPLPARLLRACRRSFTAASL